MDDLRQQRNYSGGSSGERGKSVSLARVDQFAAKCEPEPKSFVKIFSL